MCRGGCKQVSCMGPYAESFFKGYIRWVWACAERGIVAMLSHGYLKTYVMMPLKV